MKRRRTLRIWHMIMLISILTFIPVTMFIPVLHVDRESMEHVIDDIGGDEVDNSFVSVFEKALLNEIPDESANGYDVMTAEVEEGALSNDYMEVLEDNLWRVQVPMWILYFGAIPLIILIVIFFAVRRTKFVPLIPTAVYAAGGIVGSSLFLWRTPVWFVNYVMDIVEERILQSEGLSSIAGNYLNEQYDLIEKTKEQLNVVMKSFWKELLSPGMYLTFVLFIILFAALIVVAVTGNRLHKDVMPEQLSYENDIPLSGSMYCIEGQYAGASIPIESVPVIVGSDPLTCQLVLTGRPPGERYFSVCQDTHFYQVTCLSPYGLDFPGGGHVEEGICMYMRSGAEFSLNGTERFRLL